MKKFILPGLLLLALCLGGLSVYSHTQDATLGFGNPTISSPTSLVNFTFGNATGTTLTTTGLGSFGYVSTTANPTSTMEALSLMGYASYPTAVLTINQKNTGANKAVSITNAGTSNSIKIDQNGSTGRTDSSSGALLVDTSSVGNSFGVNIYSQNNNGGNMFQVNSAPQYSTTGTSGVQWLGTTTTQITTNYNGNYPSSGTILIQNGTSIGESNDSVYVTYASTTSVSGGPYSFNGVAGTLVNRTAGMNAVSGAQIAFIGTTTTWQMNRAVDWNTNGGVPDYYMIAPNPDFEMVARGGYDSSKGQGKHEIDVPSALNTAAPTSTDVLRINGRDDLDTTYQTGVIFSREGITGRGLVAIGGQNLVNPMNFNARLTVLNSNNYGDTNNGSLVVTQILGSATNTQTADLMEWGKGGDPPTIYSFINATGSLVTSGYVSGTSGLFGNLTLASSTNNLGASVYLNYPGSGGLLSTATSGWSFADSGSAGQMTSPTGTLYWVASGTNMYAAVIQQLDGSSARANGLAVDVRNNTNNTSGRIVNFSSNGTARLIVLPNGTVGINTTSPTGASGATSMKLEVVGVVSTTAMTISVPGANAGAQNYLCVSSTGTVNGLAGVCTASSARFKQNIASLSPDKLLDEVRQLREVSFDWKDEYVPREGANGGGPASTGFIAEEVAAIDPMLVIYVVGSPEDVAWERKNYPKAVMEKDGKTLIPRAVDYPRVSYVLAGAIQAEDARISALEHRISLWDKLWAALKTLFAQL